MKKQNRFINIIIISNILLSPSIFAASAPKQAICAIPIVHDKLIVKGGNPLRGTIKITGAKNSALPLMAASLLTDDTLTLESVPNIEDVRQLSSMLKSMGANIDFADGRMQISTKSLNDTTTPQKTASKLRASILTLGPLIAKHGKAKVAFPGGCMIGERPIDQHVKALEALGAHIEVDDEYVNAYAPNGLKGTDYIFDVITVGGTQNLLMAAVLAQGRTRLINAAMEPEITDLANCLVKMGAKISGINTSVLIIDGVEKLHGATHSVLPDRIETGTYAIAAAITGGELTLTNTSIDLLPTFIQSLERAGVKITKTADGFTVTAPNSIKNSDITTAPYPGFPTDLQPQYMALMALSNGESHVEETIFENRFMQVPELSRMGANITVTGRVADIHGVKELHGADVGATDLRAAASLLLEALAAKGETTINRIYYIDRGYDDIVNKLVSVGADIKRL